MLVDTPTALQALQQQLRQAGTFALDMEGLQLGSTHGKLCVISFRTLDGAPYLVDVLAFTKEQLQPLFDVLSNPAVTKLVWDGRMDACELLHGHGVQLRGALDLQIADIVARRKRESFMDQKRRLSRGYRGIPMSSITVTDFADVHRLNGLRGAAEEFGVKEKPLVRGLAGSKFDHTQWTQRPLSAEQMRYATEDVDMIVTLYSIFRNRGDIDEPSLRRQSAAYHAIHSAGRPSKDDPYQQHSMMPLDVLDLPEPGAARRSCGACRRELSMKCFSTNTSGAKCFVCAALGKEQTQFGRVAGRGMSYGQRSDVRTNLLFSF
ncbi:ribonuclease H-like domain-containing protein [Schizophyllum fasciatum]